MPTATELAREFSVLIERKKKNELDSRVLSVDMSSLEERLINAMADEGVQNISLDTGVTVYRKTDRFYGAADGVEKEELVLELGRHPQTMDLVAPNYNSNSLRARMKEIESNNEELPPELKRMIHVTEKFRVGYRSS
jgi:hypothetical protein